MTRFRRLLCRLGWHAWDYFGPARRACRRCGRREAYYEGGAGGFAGGAWLPGDR